MNGPARITALAVVLAGMVISMSGCDKLAARDQLNKGVEAYKGTHYEEAINHFQQAMKLDPTLPMAKSYLATALAQNVVPGLDTPENLKNAQDAIDIFQEVLDTNPHDVNSMKQIAGIDFQDQEAGRGQGVAEEGSGRGSEGCRSGLHDRRDRLDTSAPECSCRADSGRINDDGEGNAKAPKKVMEPLIAKNAPLVEEGLQYLTQANDNQANYDEAMAYLNLIYRRKADLDYGNEAARKADVAKADEWRDKAMETRKAVEAKKNAGPGGITMGDNGELK